MDAEKKRNRKRTLKKVFHTIVIGFAIVAFWRGVWGLMDIYLFPGNEVLSYTVSAILGIAILYLTKNLIDRLA